jgi:hypothetical protein
MAERGLTWEEVEDVWRRNPPPTGAMTSPREPDLLDLLESPDL